MVFPGLVRRGLRRLHGLREQDPVPDELRGWSYHRPPVRPLGYAGLGVSEVAYGARCGWRSLWVKRRLGVEPERSEAMEVSLLVHRVLHEAARGLQRLLARGVAPWDAAARLLSRPPPWLRGRPGWARGLYGAVVATLAGEAAGEALVYGEPRVGGWLSEYLVDGSMLGLSRRLRVDAMLDGSVVVEVKLGRPQWWHRLAVAGYALALEADREAPVDYGVVVGVTVNHRVTLDIEPVYVSPRLREEFLRARDDALEALHSDEEPEDYCGGGRR